MNRPGKVFLLLLLVLSLRSLSFGWGCSGHEIVALIAQRQLRLFASNSFPLSQVKEAFDALSSRRTIGKVVLVP